MPLWVSDHVVALANSDTTLYTSWGLLHVDVFDQLEFSSERHDLWGLQTDDEDALRDEGEEALRLQRQAAEALQAEDFEQVSEPETSDEEEEDDGIETLGKMAANGVSSPPHSQGPCSLRWLQSVQQFNLIELAWTESPLNGKCISLLICFLLSSESAVMLACHSVI